MSEEAKCFARRSTGFLQNSRYECAHLWPEGILLQCGDSGVVLASPSYQTAFFEAFPREPEAFVRGEGETVELAETKAWETFQKILACPGHEFVRRHRRDGYGYCTKCPYSTMAFESLEKCFICGESCYYGQDSLERWYCESHYKAMPVELWPEWRKLWADMEARSSRHS